MVAQRRPGEAVAPQHVTISYAGYNRPWAAWISHRLQRLGHTTVLRRWDPPAEQPLEEALSELLASPGTILMVLSDWYFELGPRTDDEWDTALHTVVEPHVDRFAAVSITTRQLPTGTGMLAPADLWRIGAEESEHRVLRRLALPAEGPYQEDQRAEAPRFPDDPPEVWGPVPRRNPRFTGRDAMLATVHDHFEQAASGAAVLALQGTPGVGKTQLAAEYAHRFASDYDLVWWVPAHSRAAMREGFAPLAHALGLDAGSEYGERIRAIHEALRIGNPHRRWLVVFDGADDPAAVAEAVPTGPGHVLITTRNRDWSSYNAELHEVPLYDREESVAFVRRRASRLSRREGHMLAQALDDLPLLLDQTAGWLGQSAMSVEEYVTLVRRSPADAEEMLQLSSAYPEAFPKAWDILLNTLRENMQEAVDLLRLCVFFAAGPVPLRLLREMGVGRLPERLTWLTDNPLKWNKALKILIQYSVVRIEYQQGVGDEAGSGVETVQMHRMVHSFVRDTMSEKERDALSRVVQESLSAADPGRPSDSRLWQRYAELVPHLEASGALESADARTQQFVLNCLRYLFHRGEYRTGLDLCRKTRHNWQGMVPEGHGHLVELDHWLANMLRMLGRYREAEKICRTTVRRLRETIDEPGDFALQRAISGLSANLMALAHYDEAQPLLEEVWEHYRDALDEDDPRTLSARNNLSIVLRLLGRYQEALEWDRSTLDAYERVLRTRHPNTLAKSIGYAWGLRLLGRYTEATSRQEVGLRLHRQVLGAHHPQTLVAQHNLALCLRRQGGDPKRVGELLRTAVEGSERALGPENPDTLRVNCDYASFLRELGEDEDAAHDRAKRVAEGYRKILGPEHPFTVGAKGNVGLTLRAAGERQEAYDLCEEALRGMRAAVGEDHPWTLGCALNAASCRNLVGRVEDAVELSRDTLGRARRVLGGQHPLTLSCEVALADDLRGTGEREEADKLEQDALQQLTRTLGGKHSHTVSARARTRPFWDFEPQLH